MHVLVATDGHLNDLKAAEMATALACEDGTVTVLTVVEIPRTFLSAMRSAYSATDVLMLDREDVSVVSSEPREHSSWPGEDAIIERYLNDQKEVATTGLVAALKTRGIEPTVVVKEGENAAKVILDSIGELNVDVVCVGSHGGGLFEGLLGSTGTKLSRLAPCPVLLIRGV